MSKAQKNTYSQNNMSNLKYGLNSERKCSDYFDFPVYIF